MRSPLAGLYTGGMSEKALKTSNTGHAGGHRVNRWAEHEKQIHQLFEDGDRALISANPEALRRVYAEDYVQYDERGRASTRRDLIANLTSGSLRLISMLSTRRTIRSLSASVAVVHGSEVDEIERGGKRSTVQYIYSDVVIKRNGQWQIVASQLAIPVD
ncbi:MAG TPA: nuclear transport factor 2 family protein [Candidatus Binatia bacterium]|nr:nuclear transport factor 2 family protein [Candidatus Binatia bacterium]